jgi:hypothetical protein
MSPPLQCYIHVHPYVQARAVLLQAAGCLRRRAHGGMGRAVSGTAGESGNPHVQVDSEFRAPRADADSESARGSLTQPAGR